MDSTDTSSYGQGNSGLNQAMQIMALKNNLDKAKQGKPKMQGGNPQPMSNGNPTNAPSPMSDSSPTQTPVPYGQGTDMGLLGAGQPYGGSTPMPSGGGN